jgi:flagellar basal-body rod protein FlgB
MSLFDATQITLERALSGAALRNTVLASNLANINTPGYQRKDVDFHSALRSALASGDPHRASFSITTDANAVIRTDGNGVDADVEAANLAKNGLEYQTLVALAKTRTAILDAAISGR